MSTNVLVSVEVCGVPSHCCGVYVGLLAPLGLNTGFTDVGRGVVGASGGSNQENGVDPMVVKSLLTDSVATTFAPALTSRFVLCSIVQLPQQMEGAGSENGKLQNVATPGLAAVAGRLAAVGGAVDPNQNVVGEDVAVDGGQTEFEAGGFSELDSCGSRATDGVQEGSAEAGVDPVAGSVPVNFSGAVHGKGGL